MVGAIVSACLCTGACASMPAVAKLLMRRKRAAHKRWFAQGLAAFKRGDEAGFDWARELPRLVEDRAISKEEAHDALCVGAKVPDITVFLPTRDELEARFELGARKQMSLSVACALAGFCFAVALNVFGVGLVPTAVFGCVLALCILIALVDACCRVIPDEATATLCLLGAGLQAASGRAGELALLGVLALALCAAMYITDAIYARLHSGARAIGNGDKKVMAAIVSCSGLSGLAPAFASLTAMLVIAAILHLDRKSKRAFGPYAALAAIIGATASILM